MLARPAKGAEMDDQEQLMKFEQFKLVYDYIKFHMGLYLVTPPVLALLAEAFGVKDSSWFRWSLVASIVVYFISGVDAGIWMGKNINARWSPDFLEKIDKTMFTERRQFMHHTLYWVGLIIGLTGLFVAIFTFTPHKQ